MTMRALWSIWHLRYGCHSINIVLASKQSERDTLRANTIEHWGYLFVYYIYGCGCTDIILYFEPCVFVFTRGLPLPITPLNRIFPFSDPVLFKEI